MSNLDFVEGGVHKPRPLTSEQEAASFRVVSPKGSVIEGEFVDGYKNSSYTISARTEPLGPPQIRMYVRHGLDVVKAARMLRAMADHLEAQKAPEGAADPFEGIEEA